MIARNESEVLERCLEGVRLFADELIIVDTGSADSTKEIAARYTERVYDYKWNDNFASARNESFRYASCDYVMWVDADDVIDEENAASLNSLKETLAVGPESVEMLYDVPESGGLIYHPRIFRRDANPKWVGRLHEYIPLSSPVLRTDIKILHRKIKPRDYRLNVRIIQKILTDSLFMDFRLAAHCWLDCHMAGEKYLVGYFLNICKKQAEDKTNADGDVCLLIANVLFHNGDYANAIEWYKMAVLSGETRSVFTAYQRLVKCCFKTERLNEARQYNEMALSINPAGVSARFNRISLGKRDIGKMDMEAYIETLKNRLDIFFRSEEAANKLAKDWKGVMKKPAGLRFIENAIPVVLCANENYAPYTAVMLQSLIEHSNPQRKYHFIIFARGFSNDSKDCLTQQVFLFPHCEIDFIDMTNALDEIPVHSAFSCYSIDVFSRFFIPYWLEEYPKVIYLDGDMVSKTDIAELYDVDMRPFCLGAAKDQWVEQMQKRGDYTEMLTFTPIFLSLKNWSRYINSGVLVFDTQKFREKVSYRDLFRYSIYYTNRYAKISPDQDIMNHFIQDDYYLLPPEWNYFWLLPEKNGKFLLRAAEPDTKLLHYSSGKPWQSRPETVNHPETPAYKAYAASVPLYKASVPLLKYLEIHLAEHCNLNCACCTHNCPVAEPGFPDISRFTRDIAKLSELTDGHIGRVRLLGGEPLLNPDIITLTRIARKYIHKGVIEIVTNGILLGQMEEGFWTACGSNNVSILITLYPVIIDKIKIEESAQKHNVRIRYESKSESGGRDVLFYSKKFDMSGKRDISKAFEYCWDKYCTFLKDGRIYLCPLIPCSTHLEKRFNVKFTITEKDYLVLDEVNDLKVILDFILRPVPFCGYCDSENTQRVYWRISERTRDEWLSEKEPS